MKKFLLGSALVILTCKTFGQIMSISPEKIVPINLLSGNNNIKDTSGEFIKHNYDLNQRIWKVRFTKLFYNKKNNVFRAFGAAGSYIEDVDTFNIEDYDIHLCAVNNDTIVCVKHLNRNDFIDNSGNFNVQFDLKKYTILIFSSSHRLPRIYDLSFLLK